MALDYDGNGLHTGLSSDTKPSPQVGHRFYETDTGDLHVYDGTYWWIERLGPFSNKKIGRGPMGGNVGNGEGMLISMTPYTGPGSQAFSVANSANGKHVRYRTSTTIGNRGGYRVNQELTIRQWNPRVRVRFAIVHSTLCRYYIGFAPLAELTGDNPIDTLDGFLLAFVAATSANYIILHNDGGTAPAAIDTGVQNTGGIREIKLVFDDANSRISWNLDNAGYNHITTDIPRTSQIQTMHFGIETAEGALKDLQIFDVFIQSDK